MNGLFHFVPGTDVGQMAIGYAAIGIVLVCLWRVIRREPVFWRSRGRAHPPVCHTCGADRRQLHADEVCRYCGAVPGKA
ncbi:MAG: hypothetical protein Tsb0013_05740 [Phycisphaerales bacterium]